MTSPDLPDRFRKYLARAVASIARALGGQGRSRRPLSSRLSQHDSAKVYEALRESIETLKEPQQTLVVRHYFQNESLSALARSAAVPESVMQHRLRRALRALRAALDRRLDDKRK
jgi:DNA-directed RNA polymerase specialized sigma24 family protein